VPSGRIHLRSLLCLLSAQPWEHPNIARPIFQA